MRPPAEIQPIVHIVDDDDGHPGFAVLFVRGGGVRGKGVISGEEDRARGLETLDGVDCYVGDVTVRRLPGVSHWVQQEAPEEVNAILAQWLRGWARLRRW